MNKKICYNGDLNFHNLNEWVKENKIPKSEWSKIKIDLDWSGCYYEGDMPSINIEYKLPKV